MKITASQVISLMLLAALTTLSNDGALSAEAQAKGGISTDAGAADAQAAGSTTQAAAVSGTASYQTNFDGTENPISEAGAWTHTGLDWTPVATANGFAHGTQAGTPSQPRANHYNDSYAVLSGFSPDQRALAVVHLAGSIDSSCSHEVEILMRWSDDAHNARGYELNLSFDGGYAQIVRWNGPYGDFTVLGGGSFQSLKDGDTFEGSIVGNVITSYVNGTKVAEVTDSTYTTGNPGIGFFRGSCGANTDVGFTSFSATGSGPAEVRPMPPSDVTAN